MQGLLKFMSRREQALTVAESQALIKAPSADLVESDTGPKLPQTYEITTQLSCSEFITYMRIGCKPANQNSYLREESLRQVLVGMNFRYHDHKEVTDFLDKQENELRQKKEFRKVRMWDWTPFRSYNHFLPPKVIANIHGIKTHYFSPDDIKLSISDLYEVAYPTWVRRR